MFNRAQDQEMTATGSEVHAVLTWTLGDDALIHQSSLQNDTQQ
jgi:hypothetical protein